MTELRYRTISAEELALGDGKEGRPALVAYKGKVYDVTPSKLWRNGKHVNAHLAGRDLTVEMGAAPHMEDVMNSFPVIGLYPDPTAQAAEASDGPAATSTSSSPDASAQSGPGDQSARDSAAAGADREPAAFISWLLSHHPHPVSVHWPIALGVVAAMLTLLELLWPLLPFSQLSPDATDGPLKVSWRYLLQQASLVNVLICALFSGPAIWTGWLSWVHNYRSKDSALFRAKIVWSWVLGAVLLVLLFVRFAMPFAGQLDGGLWYWVYSLLVISLAPIVILLGWYGGKITFPST